MIEQFGGPQGMAGVTKSKLLRVIAKAYPRGATDFADAITTALGEQTVIVAGTAAAEQVLPKLAASLRQVLDQRDELAVQVEKVVDAHPLAEVLTSMPGVGIRTAARILLDVGDASAFPSAGHLAAYAGLAPVTRRSGTSIRGEFPARAGNKHLKRALFLSAFAALKSDPTSRAYYDRKRAQGKKHNAALICLSRRRCDVLFAMIKNREPYRAPAPTPEPSPKAPRRLTTNIGTPPDMAPFLGQAGVLVMDSHTYEWLLRQEDVLHSAELWQAWFGTRPVFVFTSRQLPAPHGADVRFCNGSVADHLSALEQAAGEKTIWVQGGGDLAGQLLDAGRLDRITLTPAPAFLAAGKPLLPRIIEAAHLRLVGSRQVGQFVGVTYQVC